ncbi:uncharacterized protein BT62DRAFT_990219 [Guyanagaster necrorhizus]|uniref:RRM domain-containing protein n=1 Tax=Guyanagaster necrorhizus TaxID=856835 RepID=A0A9P7W3J0_9AGAR|nr:uncharacterized protein BT62DRAFT_990219 [Guyanagaster necrorhizus MCA 3950]KAG7451765.1 hypothetical protein BT62DRAFT_990219 [Guyanagaster necrorhizus MCA 3950]
MTAAKVGTTSIFFVFRGPAMLRIGSAVRRLQAVRFPSASYATAAASLHRTVRVENLPEGYDVSSIIETIKGNPAESVAPAKDHLLVRFFDESTARRCVEISNGVQNLSVKIDEATSSPPLDDGTIARIAKFDLTRTIRLSDIPKGLHEYDLQQMLTKYEGADVRLNLAETEADIHFLDVHHATDAYSVLKTTGATVAHRQVIPDDYIFPEWYSREGPESTQAVNITRFSSRQVREDCYRLVSDTSLPSVPFITTLLPKRHWIKAFFPTTALARQFVEESKAKSDALGVKVTLEPTKIHLGANMITAVGLGATRMISLPATVEPTSFGQIKRFFSFYGLVGQKGISCTDGKLVVVYDKMIAAASFLTAYSQGLKKRIPAQIQGATPSFYRGDKNS